MKSYSVLRMRDEKKPNVRAMISCMVIYLALAAVFGAVWKAGQDAEWRRAAFIVAVVCFVCFLFVAGLYLFATDENHLLKNTVYGKALMMYGEEKAGIDQKRGASQSVQGIMDEIDRQALEMLYACSGFTLMEDWIVLHRRFSDSFHGKNTVYSLPIRRNDIRRIDWDRLENGENSAFVVRLWVYWVASPDLRKYCGMIRLWQESPYATHAFQQADIQALRAWGASIREKQYL